MGGDEAENFPHKQGNTGIQIIIRRFTELCTTSVPISAGSGPVVTTIHQIQTQSDSGFPHPVLLAINEIE